MHMRWLALAIGACSASPGSPATGADSGALGSDDATADAGDAADGAADAAASDSSDAHSSNPACPGPPGTRTPVSISASGSLQNPSFSPDSARLLFTDFTSGYNSGASSIGIVPASGGSPKTLLAANAQNVNLPGGWNAAVDRIVVSSDTSGIDQTYVLDPSGASQPQLVPTPNMRAWEPSLSSDGQWVVFEAHSTSGGSSPGRVWKVRIDGTQATQLTPDTVDAKQPNWSPKGDRILYQARGPGGGHDIFTIDTSGGSLANVTNGGSTDNTDASWSPDGSRIVYSSDRAGDSIASLFVIAAGGGAPVRVTTGPGYDGAPSWSPDGQCIAFETSPGAPDGSSGTTIAIVPAP